MKRLSLNAGFTVLLLALVPATIAGPFDFLKSIFTKSNPVPANITTLTQDQMVAGLKEALGRGVEQAVASLGRSNGFLTNLQVRIPMPEQFKSVESGLRLAGQGRLADEFVGSMNHAAERAVPAAAEEKNIRANPIARTTGLLQTVFGAAK